MTGWRPGAGERVAVLLGAEGPGLSPAALAAAHLRLTIPMRRAEDSLNVGSAAAIAFYVLTGIENVNNDFRIRDLNFL